MYLPLKSDRCNNRIVFAFLNLNALGIFFPTRATG